MCLNNPPISLGNSSPNFPRCSSMCTCAEYTGKTSELSTWSQNPASKWKSKPNAKANGGTYWNNRPAIASKSVSDGAWVLDADSLHLGNYAATISALLTSPQMNISSYTANTLFLSFHQYYRAHTSTTAIEYSFDQGTTWTTSTINQTLQNGDETAPYDYQIIPIPIPAHTAQYDSLQIRFSFSGHGYFWIIDDIKICDEYPSPTLPNPSLGQLLYNNNLPYAVDKHGHAHVPDEFILTLNVSTAPAIIPLTNGDHLQLVRTCECDTLHTYRYVTNASLATYPSPIGGSISIEEKGKAATAASSGKTRTSDINYYVFSELENAGPCQPNSTSPLSNISTFPLLHVDTGQVHKVAILDTGIDPTNPNVSDFIYVKKATAQNAHDNLFGYNFVADNNNPIDDNGHGTHVTATAMRTLHNNFPNNCNIQASIYKTHDKHGISNLANVACAIRCAMRDSAKVINCSWGYYTDSIEHSRILYDVIKAASNQGIMFVCSAGNDSTVLQHPHLHLPSSFNSITPNGYFQPLNNVLSIGSTNNASAFSSFSNRSPIYVDAGCAGETIIAPDICGLTRARTGTSMSAAQVSAAVADRMYCTPGASMQLADIKNDVLGQCGFSTGSGLTRTGNTILYDCCSDLLRITGDSIGCDGDTLLLTAQGSSSYLWNTGATTASIEVITGGVYTVTATGFSGCVVSKSKTINLDSCIQIDNSYQCNTYMNSNLLANTWNGIADSRGRKVVSINPGGNNLGTVSVQMLNHHSVQRGGGSPFCGSGVGQPYLPRYFNIESSVASTFPTPVRIRLFFYNDEFDLYNNELTSDGCPSILKDELEVFHYDGLNEDCNFNNNTGLASLISSSDIRVQALGTTGFFLEFEVMSFSEFGAGISSSSILPIELMYFTGKKEGEHIALKWATATEQNNDYFLLERSKDGVNFIESQQVDGNGNSTEPKLYSYIDKKPESGMNYYRLRQVDLDGTKSSSQLVAVDFDADFSVNVFPNPFNASFTLETFNSVSGVEMQVQLLDLNGMSVLNETVLLNKGLNRNVLSTEGVPSGMYYLKAVSSMGSMVIRLVKN